MKRMTHACASSAALMIAMTCAAPAMAQQAAKPAGAPPTAHESRQTGSLLDDIVVTAAKQSRAQANQSVPITISAFSSAQLETLKLTNVQRLAYSMPNVSFDSPGSTKSTANFTIRGLGVNSSIASTAPTVGVFKDGMYLGINQGVLVDTFDLEGIEVLRGPQGTLFGRNVTGGAVLLNQRKPRQEADFKARVRYETGPEYSVAVAGGGGVTDTVSVRLAAQYRLDRGYFNNVTLGDKHFGRDKSWLVQPSVRFDNGVTDVTLFGEIGGNTGDGPVDVAPDYQGGTVTTPGTLPPRGLSRNVYENYRGYTDLKWHSLILNGTHDVDVGEDGQIALISGYRKFTGASGYASDGTELTVSHNGAYTRQHQISNELRYNGRFGFVTATLGLYQFSQSLEQLNKQFVINSTQGGRLSENAFGVFGQLDFAVADRFTIQLGGRYNYEKKRAQIAALAPETTTPRAGTFGVPGSCSLEAQRCNYQYFLEDSWKNFSPKVSVRYQLDHVLLYATAQKAFRSGGFNIRYNSPGAPPPYDPEKQDAFEAGFKTDLFDRKTRFNGAIFYTKVKNLQRDITIFLPDLTNQTSTFNTADADTKGFELELVQQIIPNVVFNGNVGYVKARYTHIRYDITQDGLVNDFDLQQKLPRVSPWTYTAGLTASHDFAFGKVTFNGTYNHRDASYFPDYNTGRKDGAVPLMPAANLFDAQISWDPANTGVSFTLYGRNLTNDFTLSAFTPIVYPTLKGCACLPNEGRVIGVEASVAF